MTNFIDSKQIIENLVTKDTPLVEQEFFSNLNESNQIVFLNKLKKACSFVNGWANNNFVNYLKEKVLTLTFEELNPVTGEMTNEFIYRLEDILVYPEGIIAWLTENGSDPQNNSASTFLPQYASNWAQAIWMIAIHWFKNNTSPDENVLGGQGVSFSDSPNSTFSKENDVIQNYVPQDAYQLLKVNKFVEWYKGNKLNQTIYDQQFLTKSDLTSVETQIDKNTEAIADQQNQINNLEVSGGVSEEDLITTKILDKENSDEYGYNIYQSDLNITFNNRTNDTAMKVGDLTTLTTTLKDNLVNAINEVNAKPTSTGGASTTTELIYDGTNPLLIGQNQTQIDDTFKSTLDLKVDYNNPRVDTNFVPTVNNELVPFETLNKVKDELQAEIDAIGGGTNIDNKLENSSPNKIVNLIYDSNDNFEIDAFGQINRSSYNFGKTLKVIQYDEFGNYQPYIPENNDDFVTQGWVYLIRTDLQNQINAKADISYVDQAISNANSSVLLFSESDILADDSTNPKQFDVSGYGDITINFIPDLAFLDLNGNVLVYPIKYKTNNVIDTNIGLSGTNKVYYIGVGGSLRLIFDSQCTTNLLSVVMFSQSKNISYEIWGKGKI